VQLIQTAADLASLVERLRREPLVAVDTEAASFHRYQDRIYLLQLSSRQETAVVDPLAAGTLAPIGELLADPAVEIVFHDADYDLRLLDREYNLHAEALFDTRVAAQLLNEPGIGLAALLEKYLGIRLDKRFQRADCRPGRCPPTCWPMPLRTPVTCRSCVTSWLVSWKRGAGWNGPGRNSVC